jgi:predicted dehydrogenase
MKKQKVGVVGWLVNFQSKYGVTTAACDVNAANVNRFASQHKGVVPYLDYRKMAKEAGLDAVVISSPNWLHREMAECFLGHGIHVFVEKPMGVNRADLDAVVRAQRKSGKICAIDFEMRVSRGCLRVREIVSSGEIGALNGVEFIHHRGGWLASGNGVWRTNPKLSGGLFLMEICHAVDYFRFLFGEITHVQSFTHDNVLPQYPANMPDNVVTHIWFEGGRKGTIISAHTSSPHDAPESKYDDLGHDMYFIVTGTKGCIRAEVSRKKIMVARYAEFHPDAKRGARVELKRLEDYSSLPGGAFGHDIGANYEAFLRACATGKPFYQDTLDAWKTHAVCLAAEKSAIGNSPRIKVDYRLG